MEKVQNQSVAEPDTASGARLTIAERRALGKQRRDAVPRDAHSGWTEPAGRGDPIALLIDSGKHRIRNLLSVRYDRMLESPFAFLRGAAVIMAADLAPTPTSGMRVQACGDCHLANFGAYLSPEGTAVFDINDFDETLPAPFEWDIKRLATSIVLAGRHAVLGEKISTKSARAAVRAYREHMTELARLDPIQAWNSRIDMATVLKELDDPALIKREAGRLAGTDASNPVLYAFPKLAGQSDGTWRITDHPPLIYHFDEAADGAGTLRAAAVFERYRLTLPEERRILYDRYRLIDTAFKVVGVGSVGTFCAIGLFMTADEAPLFLQLKEAQASVLAPYAGACVLPNQGERVVVGQRVMQASSDVFLGWAEDVAGGRHFYVRQLKDKKLALMGPLMQRSALEYYAVLCGRTLARAHARSGDAAEIAGYLGASEAFDAALEEFATDYADRTERDYRLLVQARRAGRV